MQTDLVDLIAIFNKPSSVFQFLFILFNYLKLAKQNVLRIFKIQHYLAEPLEVQSMNTEFERNDQNAWQ